MADSYIAAALRRSATRRARERCEYCQLHQDDTPFTHQIDHVIPRKHGGPTTSLNLALSCLECNRHKGSDLTSLDPDTHAITPLFNPRAQMWAEHFALEGARIVGLTASGRATVSLLRLNDSRRVMQRQVLIGLGRYPPP